MDTPSNVAPDPEQPSSWATVPAWLRLPPAGDVVDPPVATKTQLLPFSDLRWEDFERLCLRVLASQAELVHVQASLGGEATRPETRLYGKRGQAQFGIDLYSRDPL